MLRTSHARALCVKARRYAVRHAPCGTDARDRVDYGGAMNAWHWELLDTAGQRAPGAQSPTFPTQSEAESWIGEQWPQLFDDGVDAVTLYEGDTSVYGPMSLRPSE